MRCLGNIDVSMQYDIIALRKDTALISILVESLMNILFDLITWQGMIMIIVHLVMKTMMSFDKNIWWFGPCSILYFLSLYVYENIYEKEKVAFLDWFVVMVRERWRLFPVI